MKFSLAIVLSLALGCLLAGCVSEPAPPESTTYGHVDSPKEARHKKHAQLDATEVQVVPGG